MHTASPEPPSTLPWTFDATSVWHTILGGAFALNGVLVVGVLVKLITREWLAALGLSVAEAVVAGFTRIFLRYQEGSRGTVFPDRVEIEPNTVIGVPLPGPGGVHPLTAFRAIRVEFRMGSPSADPNAAGPHERVWLVGDTGAPNIVVARTRDGAGHRFGERLGALLGLPVEEVGLPRRIEL